MKKVSEADIQRYFDLGNADLLKQRIESCRDVFEEYGIDNFCISYSGGRDSNVTSELIDLAVPGNRIPRVFMHTGIELNSVVDFVKKRSQVDSRIHIISPQVGIKKSLEVDGYPFKSKMHSKKVNLYRRQGITQGVYKYIYGDGNPNHYKFLCPEKLKYQFTPENKLKISMECCINMKEKPLQRWQKIMGRGIGITGMRQAEEGSRANVKCLSMRRNEKVPRFFNPLSICDDTFVEWMIRTYEIELPSVYYPPYNFERTGCKGCPFNRNLQKELDILEEYFPKERKQCEIIWKPVYDEYRRLGYRLRKDYEYGCSEQNSSNAD